jgi:hypothetical protein
MIGERSVIARLPEEGMGRSTDGKTKLEMEMEWLGEWGQLDDRGNDRNK